MKRFISLFLCLAVLVVSCYCLPAKAAEYDVPENQTLVSKTVQYLEDGSRIETAIYEEIVKTRASSYMKSGSKVRSAYNADGNLICTLTVRGVFSVDEGVSATCTSVSHSTSIVDDDWSCTSSSSSKSGNRATANGTFKRTLLGVTVDTQNLQVTLQCDDLGNLS